MANFVTQLAPMALASGIAVLSGCTTIVSGGPATPGAYGKIYNLPLSLLEVKPNADGTLSIAPVSIPDPNHTYVVNANSVLASYTFDVAVQNGLLKSVSMDAKAADVGKSAIDAAAAIQKAKIETDAKIAALEAKNNAKGEKPAADTGTAGSGMGGESEAKIKTGVAYGPVYYRIAQAIDPSDNLPTVVLIAARYPEGPGQTTFKNVQIVPPAGTAGAGSTDPTKPLSFAPTPDTVQPVTLNAAKMFQFNASAQGGEFSTLKGSQGTIVSSTNLGSPLPQVASLSQIDNKTISVAIPGDVPTGKYIVRFEYFRVKGGEEQHAGVTIELKS